MLLGCYRTGDANDPDTYVAAIAATLARYPEKVITEVTHPVSGLPKEKSWLPSIKEVFDACEKANEFAVQHELRLKRIREQLEMRERMDRGEKPTLEQLHSKYGKDWGLSAVDPEKQETFKAPTWDQIGAFYSSDPSQLERLLTEKYK